MLHRAISSEHCEHCELRSLWSSLKREPFELHDLPHALSKNAEFEFQTLKFRLWISRPPWLQSLNSPVREVASCVWPRHLADAAKSTDELTRLGRLPDPGVFSRLPVILSTGWVLGECSMSMLQTLIRPMTDRISKPSAADVLQFD